MNMAEAGEGADGITFADFATGKYAAMLPSFDTYSASLVLHVSLARAWWFCGPILPCRYQA